MERLLACFIYIFGVRTQFSICFLIGKLITLPVMVIHKQHTEPLFTEQTQGALFLWTTFPALNQQKTAMRSLVVESVHKLLKLRHLSRP